jgi:hypothetical protein
MEEIRLLTKSDAVEIVDLMNTRSTMVNASVKLPDYSNWLRTDAAYDPDRERHYGLFNDGILQCYSCIHLWEELPMDIAAWSGSLFTRERDNVIKDNFGHPVDSIKLVNFHYLDLESIGYKSTYQLAHWHPTKTKFKPHFMNPNARVSKYKVLDIETINPGEIPKNKLFQKYLLRRPYDIPMYIRKYTYTNGN